MKTTITLTHPISIINSDFLTEAVKYFVVGGFCTALDFALLFIFTYYYDINYIISSITSFISGTALNYFLCTFWIFRIRVIQNGLREFFYYFLITGFGLCVNTLLIWSCTTFLGFHFLFSKLIAAFVTYWWNFGARKYCLHTIR
jgi:putative flippase GtrA